LKGRDKLNELDLEQDDAEDEILETLIDNDMIHGEVLEIAKLVLANGELNQRQQTIFDCEIDDKFYRLVCERCGERIPIGEIPNALVSGEELCGAHDEDEDDED